MDGSGNREEIGSVEAITSGRLSRAALVDRTLSSFESNASARGKTAGCGGSGSTTLDVNMESSRWKKKWYPPSGSRRVSSARDLGVVSLWPRKAANAY